MIARDYRLRFCGKEACGREAGGRDGRSIQRHGELIDVRAADSVR